MSEEVEKHTEEVKQSATGLWKGLRNLIREIFNVRADVDKEGASVSIKKDITFRGFNIWILILSILICSIGLNLNSTAIIIGAMLISPLMGPITGLGFAIGTFDRDLFGVAIKNLAIAVVISVLASFLFFSFAPTSFDHSELDSRTAPGVLDLLVALFGGFAGILAGTRGSKTNVIPGVAIATALMPPLCTVGYGLAIQDMDYVLGASYLFFINSVFISLAALVVVRYLRFPIASYVNPKVQRRAKALIVFFVLILAVPSFIIYGNAIRESIFVTQARNFIAEQMQDQNRTVINPQIVYGDSSSVIKLFIYGDEYSETQKDSIRQMMGEYGLENTTLEIHNMGTFDAFKSLNQKKDEIIGETQELKNQLGLELALRNAEKKRLQSQLERLERSNSKCDAFIDEAKIVFQDIEGMDFAVKPLDDSLGRFSTVIMVDWKKSTRSSIKKAQNQKLRDWVALKFEESDSIRVVEVE